MSARDGTCMVTRCRNDADYRLLVRTQPVAVVCNTHAAVLGTVDPDKCAVTATLEQCLGWTFAMRIGGLPVLYPPGVHPHEPTYPKTKETA